MQNVSSTTHSGNDTTAAPESGRVPAAEQPAHLEGESHALAAELEDVAGHLDEALSNIRPILLHLELEFSVRKPFRDIDQALNAIAWQAAWLRKYARQDVHGHYDDRDEWLSKPAQVTP